MARSAKSGRSPSNAADGAALVLLGHNLRIDDNPALLDAAASGQPVIPVFVADDAGEDRAPGGASRWWRAQSLFAFDSDLRARGSRIVLRVGNLRREIEDVIRQSGARVLHLTWRLRPDEAEIDNQIVALCRDLGVEIIGHPANYLHDPTQLRTGVGAPFKVFTPFWNRLLGTYSPPTPRKSPKGFRAPRTWPQSVPLAAIALKDSWATGLSAHWEPGAGGARTALDAFVKGIGAQYIHTRDRPGISGTSRLSPHLTWGEISIHEVWRDLRRVLGDNAAPYLRQLGWRDFNMHLAIGFGELSTRPMRGSFDRFPFLKDPSGLVAWQRGRTGYPIVDAGMRELWATGWMHNRARMISASFLVKDLLIDWRLGEAWFWDTLVDADAAQNPGNWQWVTGCGADAAPYFRIFNPVTQARRFDPDGDYVRRWVPELARLANEHLHAPWEAPPMELEAVGVRLGRDYPLPIVDHATARKRALTAYKTLNERPGPASIKRV